MHRFESELILRLPGQVKWHGIEVPLPVVEALGLAPKSTSRFRGSFNGAPFEGAIQPVTGGGFCIHIGRELMRRSGAGLGSKVTVELELTGADAVDVPEDLAHALARDEELEFKWSTLTPGAQRGQIYLISQAKRPETREARIQRLVDALQLMTPFEGLPRGRR